MRPSQADPYGGGRMRQPSQAEQALIDEEVRLRDQLSSWTIQQAEDAYGQVRYVAGRAGCCIGRSGKLYKARSRLYRNQILQVIMRLKALVEIYTKH